MKLISYYMESNGTNRHWNYSVDNVAYYIADNGNATNETVREIGGRGQSPAGSEPSMTSFMC